MKKIYFYINGCGNNNHLTTHDIDNIHFISYGDEKYENSKKRIYNEAIETGWFTSVEIFDKIKLSKSFCEDFKYILKYERGGGYWIWKFDIILNKLYQINDGDFLIYLDCGCSINKNGYNRFKEYIKLIKSNQYKIISFQTDHNEYKYTTKQIFDAFNVSQNSEITLTKQFVGGILIMQKCVDVINLFNDCINTLRKYPYIITDKYNNAQQTIFIDNRHDQSIMSVARKIHGSIVIPNETEIAPDYNINNYPFLATRLRN